MSPAPPREPRSPAPSVALVALRGRRRRSAGRRPALLLLLLVIVVVGMGRLAEPAAHGRGEIQLEPTAAAGPHAFTASVATGHPAPAPAAASPGGATAPGQAGNAAKVITTTRGSQPGLYGGSRQAATCDAQRLITDLQQTPVQAAAWAEVEGIAPGDLPSFAGGLTSAVLRGDTRVTDHGFVKDHHGTYQAVLEAGTGVMVDHFGVPRVRCISGDPLTPPVAVVITPRYVGTRWPGFQPAGVTVVTAATQPLTSFVLVDSGTGARFSRPVGTDGRADTDAAAGAPAS